MKRNCKLETFISEMLKISQHLCSDLYKTKITIPVDNLETNGSCNKTFEFSQNELDHDGLQ